MPDDTIPDFPENASFLANSYKFSVYIIRHVSPLVHTEPRRLPVSRRSIDEKSGGHAGTVLDDAAPGRSFNRSDFALTGRIPKT
jgi:hypothetical protein